jgi:hypothetical protein
MWNPKFAEIGVIIILVVSSAESWAAPSAGAAPSSEIDRLFQHSMAKRQTKEGRLYEDRFLKVVDPVLRSAMTACSEHTPDTIEPGSIAFIIGADGHVKRLLWSDKIPMAQCVGQRMRSITTLPRPPEDNWIAGAGVANHTNQSKNAPVDKPARANKEQEVQYDKAIAPYVAKARTSYPAAKARFLAGLPPGYRFSVRVRLFDPNGLREDAFLNVTKISGHSVTGVLASIDLIHSYKTGQTITVNESAVDNWLFQRPDGTEEGNYVGKFLDHYKMQ